MEAPRMKALRDIALADKQTEHQAIWLNSSESYTFQFYSNDETKNQNIH